MTEVLLGEDVVHVLSGRGSLKLLSVQHLLLELVKRLSGCDVGLGHLTVTATGAGGNQIGNTARFEEGLIFDIGVKHLGELAHFVESNADDSSLGVIAELESIDQSTANGDNVLEGTAQFDTDDIRDNVDSEGWGVEDIAEELAVSPVSVSDGGLAELLLGNLVGNVGTAENTGGDSEGFLDHVGDETETIGVDVDTLDQGDSLAVGGNPALELLANACDKLMGDNKDKHGGISASLQKVGAGNNVRRQLDAGKVFDVLMLGVNDLGQVLTVDFLLKDPHLDLVVKVVELAHIASDNLGDGRTPVA